MVQQAVTPPRPATQSPVMVAGPPQPMAPPMQGQPLYAPSYVVPVSMTSMTPTVVQTTQQPRFDHRKRAVVSVQPRAEFNPTAAAAAAAATGQPLLAAQPTAMQANTPQYTVQYNVMTQQGAALGAQPGSMPQMVPMPPTAGAGTRMMAPPVQAGQQSHEAQGQNTIYGKKNNTMH